MRKPLPLWEGAVPCIRCGYCCRRYPCGFGTWSREKGGCAELVENLDGTCSCGAYGRIMSGEDLSWTVSPAFGAGCCSPMNGDRRELERKAEVK